MGTKPASTTLLQRYELSHFLGCGGFAKVYAARRLADGELVAVKTIDKARTNAVMESRIISEISAMRRLQDHPNILKIHEVMATKAKIHLVMDIAQGGELFARITKRGKLKESTARVYFQQLVSALHFCHQNGVSHRDVKPQNLLLDGNGNVKLSDFGLSSVSESRQNVLHTACGTPAFAAPEVMTQRSPYDGAKADAWSCGVILFFLLTATLPFDDQNMAAMCRSMHRREYLIPQWVSKPARWVITKLLDPNPATRIGVESLMKNSSWVAKRAEPVNQSGGLDLGGTKGGRASDVNAFDIISLSSGLDLSGLFDALTKKRRRRFTSGETAERVMERVREVGRRLGHGVVEEGESVGIEWGRERRVALVFEVMEFAEKAVVVGVRVVEGSGASTFDEDDWWQVKDALGDVVLQWHSDIF